MTDEQANKIISLLSKLSEQVSKGIDLLDKQVKLFEKYDADVFNNEEIQREIHGSPWPRGG